ncbi:MAG: hypothetical protein GY696_04240 [Gammaproteobacteria bacterium]|nr:hypothetical protein [Gammaproteobacteria bacterium]
MSYEILTKNTVRELTGWSYVNLKWHYICGVFSEVGNSPQSHEARPGDPGAVQAHDEDPGVRPALVYKGLAHLAQQLEFLHPHTESGDLEAYPDHVFCKGEESKEGKKLTVNMIVLMELRVTRPCWLSTGG